MASNLPVSFGGQLKNYMENILHEGGGGGVCIYKKYVVYAYQLFPVSLYCDISLYI